MFMWSFVPSDIYQLKTIVTQLNPPANPGSRDSHVEHTFETAGVGTGTDVSRIEKEIA